MTHKTTSARRRARSEKPGRTAHHSVAPARVIRSGGPLPSAGVPHSGHTPLALPARSYPLVTAGPYRWIRHPNYVGVVGELVGIALLTGARVSGPVGTVLFGMLILKRIRVEDHALSASTR